MQEKGKNMHAALYSTHSSSLGFFGSMLKEIALRWKIWLMEENEKRKSEVLQDNSESPCRVMQNKKIFSFLYCGGKVCNLC
jgi:hypothetical protein